MENWLFIRKYRLSILFSLAAMLFILTAGVVISHTISQIAEINLVRIAERGITDDTVEMLFLVRDPSQPLSVHSLAKSDSLSEALPMLVQKYRVVKLHLLDATGQVIWSTDRSTVGQPVEQSPLFQMALAGQIASKFSADQQVADLDGLKPSLSIVETNVPLRDPTTAEVVGVLQIYRNVTDDVPFIIEATRSSVLRVTAVTMAALFLVLLVVVVIADMIISRAKGRERVALEEQLAERRQAALALMDSNQKLEAVVQELKDTQQQIIQQERLRALGEMASGIAHDFNNALTPILGFATLMIEEPDELLDIEEAKTRLKIIKTGAEDAAAVVARLKEFYRHQDDKDQFASVDLADLANMAISLTQAKWKDQAMVNGATINIESNLQKVPDVQGDAPIIREALINLIINAVDAMPEGGTIEVSTYQEGTSVVLSVSDTGKGMTEEVRRRCLEPFFTTKGSLGTGMGLSMVYGIAKRHGGTLDIGSEPGQGASFIIRIPVQQKPREEDSEVMVEANSLPPLHLLVVDDEPMVSQLLTAFLNNDGHTAVTAVDSRQGLEQFQNEHFDLVLTDRAMPGMNGDQLALAIKEISPETPVIMLTGFGDIMAATDEKPAGADLVLGKPITMDDLRQALVTAMTSTTSAKAAPSQQPEALSRNSLEVAAVSK